jgi:hypothetical protein
MYIIISLCIVRPLRRLLDEQFGEFGEIENIKVSQSPVSRAFI